MKSALSLAALLLAVSVAVFAQDIAGDWKGTLHAGPAELRLALHVAKSADGHYTATLDSLDQGANGIPVNAVTLKETTLNLTVDAVRGTYEGKVNSDATAITGTWTQGQPLPLEFTRGTFPVKPAPKPAKPTDIDGEWLGIIDTGAAKLRVAFHITNTEDGLIATMDSLDQGAKGMPVTVVTRSGASLKMELKQLGGAFNGKITGDTSVIDGTWTQGGNTFSLALKRTKDKP